MVAPKGETPVTGASRLSWEVTLQGARRGSVRGAESYTGPYGFHVRGWLDGALGRAGIRRRWRRITMATETAETRGGKAPTTVYETYLRTDELLALQKPREAAGASR